MQLPGLQGCFWGVRGSFPSGRPEHQTLGGNTPCLAISAPHNGQTLPLLIIDAGTGLLGLALSLLQTHPVSQFDILLCISHAHWDHISGFPAFVELLGPRANIKVVSLKRPAQSYSIENSLRWQQSRCPQTWEQIQARIEFAELSDRQSLSFQNFQVSTAQLNHPGYSSGFLVQAEEGQLAYISDIAPVCDILLAEPLYEDEQPSQLRQRLYDNEMWLANHAQTVIYDTFFTDPDFQGRPHWGHSTLERALSTCSSNLVERLFLFHHNSEYSDEFQLKRVAEVPASMEVRLAQERVPFFIEVRSKIGGQ